MIPVRAICLMLLSAAALVACGRGGARHGDEERGGAMAGDETRDRASDTAGAGCAQATFGAGCFWCVEAAFEGLDGVTSVVSGYSGGHVENPTYEQVCSKTTGHAEVCRITYDPGRISYEDLLDLFWKLHDPTTPGRQGNDVGPQYRSVIFYHDEGQKRLAEDSKRKLEAAGVFADPIVTEIVPAAPFYPAEEYHQDYFRRNPDQAYCRLVIAPKLAKLEDR